MAVLGGSCQNNTWVITSEERAKHDVQFLQLNPVGGYISGDQAKHFFLQSGLTKLVLGHIWKLADLTADGRMDRKEFSIAMHLIKKSLLGHKLPETLASSLLIDPPPMTLGPMQRAALIPPMLPASNFVFSPMIGMPAPMASGPAQFSIVNPNRATALRPTIVPSFPASLNPVPSSTTMSTITRDWSIPSSQKVKYSQIFISNDRLQKGFLTGHEAKAVLSQSGLPKSTLAQIWNLADVDKDGNLSSEEFCVAMHLSEIVKSGQSLPLVLPRELIPASGQRIRHTSGPSASGGSQSLSASVDSFDRSAMMISSGSGLNSVSKRESVSDLASAMGLDGLSGKSLTLGPSSNRTFEDRRKENFERGQAELERRREMLRDAQRKETEDRLAFEKSEQEKREKHRLEQELRKQRELDKQREKQRLLEVEKEEQRRKALEQRETARQEMERQRQMEWQRQRRDQLMTERTREQTLVDQLELEVGQLKMELSTLDNKKLELHAKIEQSRCSIADFTSSIENMRVARDTTVAKNNQLTSEVERWTQKMSSAEEDRKVIEKQVYSQTPVLDDNYKAVAATYKQLKGSVEKLQTMLQNTAERKALLFRNIESNNQQLSELKIQMNTVQHENLRLKKLLSEKREAAKKRSKSSNKGIANEKPNKRESYENLEIFNNSSDLKNMKRPAAACNGHHTESWKDLQSETFASAEGGSWADTFFTKTSKGDVAKTNVMLPYRKYTALYQFDARKPDELNLMVGDVVLVSPDQSEVPTGWLNGKLGDREGLFPENYVSLISDVDSASADTSTLNGPAPTIITSDHSKQYSNLNDSKPREKDSRSKPYLNMDMETISAPSPTPGQGQDAPDELYVEAIYPWRAKKDYHLTFDKGDVIRVTHQQDTWWSGEMNGKVGWFPKSYVKIVEKKESVHSRDTGTPTVNHSVDSSKVSSDISIQSDSMNQSQSSASAAVSPTKSDLNAGNWYVALYDYSSTETGDLAFNAGDVINVVGEEGQWWKGILNGRMGDFPANYVAKQEAASDSNVSSVDKAESRMSPAPTFNNSVSQSNQKGKKPEIASVIASYEASGPEQLSLQVGQLISVRKKSPSGWWEGELQARGQRKRVGWFPANYVKLLVQSSARSTPDASTPTNEAQAVREVKCSTPVVSASPVEQVIAIYDYEAQHSDELSFYKGSVINIIQKDGSNWWKGELNGQTGLLPSNYVQPLSESTTGSNPMQSTELPLKNDGVFDEISDTEKKRQDHIRELIATEESYLKDLTTVIEVFYKPMMVNKILNEEELNTIFINWKELKQCNMKLLKAMRVRRKMCGEGQPIHMIGDILCENLIHMLPYIRFCSCQLNSAALLQKKYENDSKFKEVHKRCCQTDSRTLGLPLSSFLLKPMQRITKYPLLLEKIFKFTPVDHPDHQNLQEALNKAAELCSQVNEGVREKENSDRLEWIQTHVHCDGLSEKITFNSPTNCLGPRRYVHSGTLCKVKSGKELVGILFNDFLLLTQPQRPLGNVTSLFTPDMKSNVHLKMYRNPLFLNEVMIQKPQDSDTESAEKMFLIKHIHHTYSFRTSTTNERDNWIKKIESTSKQYLETELKKNEKAHAAGKKTPAVGRLLVVIVEGSNLTPGEDGKSDPYCEVSMGIQEHKTKVVQSTLNPKWNASMQFTIKDLKEDVLCITVYDRDLFSPNDFLGRTEVRICDILKETSATKGPITRRLLLHEVESGEVVVKLDLQLFGTM